jgi:hypothetical protein
VANHGASSVWGYTINALTGVLTSIAGSPFATPGAAQSVAVDSTGEFAYATGGGFSGYTINATTGALTPIPGSPFHSRGSFDFVAVDPSGKFVYGVDYWDGFPIATGDVYGDRIDATTGALTPITGSPFTPCPPGFCSGGFFSTSIALSGEIH